MAKKKQEQPKIATPVDFEQYDVPEYKKPYADFKRTVKVGDLITLSVRGKGELIESSGEVIETYQNGLRWRDAKTTKIRSKPWWGIHDWEIYEGGDDEITKDIPEGSPRED